MKFLSGLVLGGSLCGGAWTLSAQNERAMHPRIATAITALKDARADLESAPIRQLNFAPTYRAKEDRR